jgi:hypothetical protein
MFFNRFRIEWVDDLCLFYFGLAVPSIGLADYYCCGMWKRVLEERRDTLMKYLDRMGRSTEKPTPWQASGPQMKVDVADAINMAHGEAGAEIIFCSFSQWGLNLVGREAKGADISLEADPVALLRSELPLHRQFIEALYV